VKKKQITENSIEKFEEEKKFHSLYANFFHVWLFSSPRINTIKEIEKANISLKILDKFVPLIKI